MATQYRVDMKAALQQSAACLLLHKAAKKQATDWAAKSVEDLMRSAKKLQKSGKGRKGGQTANNIDFTVSASDTSWEIVVGTGVKNKASVKYARIQDKGGTTHPNVTDKMRRYAWAMYFKNGGGKRKRGKGFEAANDKATMFKRLALTKKSKLEVKIPPTYWFTQVMSYDRKAALGVAMSPDAVMARARTMVK